MGNDISSIQPLPEVDTFMKIMRKVDKLREAGFIKSSFTKYFLTYYFVLT